MAKITVDNYGPKPSQDYARAQSQIEKDPSFRKDSSAISQKTQIAVLSPAQDQLSQILMDSGTVQPLATFCAPSFYHSHNTPTFASQLTPSIGPASKWESSSQKMRNALNSLPNDDPQKAILTKFIDTADQLDKSIIWIKAKLQQFTQS